MQITYTFPADFQTPELRGVTATGGQLCRIDGKWMGGAVPDAVKFAAPRLNGKVLIARIAGKPELEAVLAQHLEAQARKAARLAEIKWPEYQAIQRRADNAQGAYDRASDYGYPAREAEALKQAQAALDQARIDYPMAALYAQAEAFSFASNDVKAGAGRKAMAAIEQGQDPEQAVAAMRAAWSDYIDGAAARD